MSVLAIEYAGTEFVPIVNWADNKNLTEKVGWRNYERVTRMIDHLRSQFGGYYTKPAIGQTLIGLMSLQKPEGVIDLGTGGGSLILAAVRRWPNLNLLTIDIDPMSDQRLAKLLASEAFNCHHHIQTDVLEPELAGMVISDFGRFDAVVCNPPFTKPLWRNSFKGILEDAGFSGCMPVLAEADSALLFLAQALRLLGQGSILGIILPDNMISGAKYLKFRKDLLRQYQVDAVVRLPRRAFRHTDAIAHIVIIRKGGGASGLIPLRRFSDGRLSTEAIMVNVEQAIIRMDYNFHAISAPEPDVTKSLSVSTLGEVALGVHRGSVQATASRQAGMQVFHTTEMPESLTGRWITLSPQFPTPGDKRIWAEPGDLLIARVGRNLERKVVGVRNGHALLSDCVYRLRMPPSLATLTLRQLSSDYGRDWLNSRSSGVGAKQLCLADLLTFPIHLTA